MLVEDHKLDAVIKLPAGVFRPYAGVSTAILVFTKTGVGGTEHVWFYEMESDGWSLDDKRQPLLPDDKVGPTPKAELTDDDHAKNNLPDFLMRWKERDGTEGDQPRTAQSFCVPKAQIAALLVLIATYNGGGSGTFYTLHILDVSGQRVRSCNFRQIRRALIPYVRMFLPT